MKIKPLSERTGLPEAIRRLPGKIFVRRPPATHAEAARDDVIFGVKTFDDLFDRSSPERSKPPNAD